MLCVEVGRIRDGEPQAPIGGRALFWFRPRRVPCFNSRNRHQEHGNWGRDDGTSADRMHARLGDRQHGRERTELSGATRHPDRAVRGWWTRRHHRARRCGTAFPAARPAVHRRERCRRRRHHRRDARRARGARRLHTDPRPHGHARRRSLAVSEPCLQAGDGFRADRARRRIPGRARHAKGFSRRTRCASLPPTRRKTKRS